MNTPAGHTNTNTTGDAPTGPTREHAAAIAAGLRHCAAMLTEHPHLAENLRHTVYRMLVSVGHGGAAARAEIATFARAGLACGATVTEHDNGKYAGVNVAFGPVTLHVYADVEQVHDVTRIVEYTPCSILAEIEAAA